MTDRLSLFVMEIAAESLNSIYHDPTIVCSLERLVQFRLKQCVEIKIKDFF